MINYEIPRNSIVRLSEAFRAIETVKRPLGVLDYALSQSTLEQGIFIMLYLLSSVLICCILFFTVFLKQIRPNRQETLLEQLQDAKKSEPNFRDFFQGYLCLFFALLLPGLHHFWLGNIWRGLKYFFTLNEFYVGWFLDLFEINSLIRKSVEEKGNSRACCCGKPEKKNDSTISNGLNQSLLG